MTWKILMSCENLAVRARRLAEETPDERTRDRLVAAATEYEQRAKEADVSNLTDE